MGPVDRGDEFARFYAAYAPRLAGVARRWVEEASVDDVVQETLLRAYDAGLDRDGRDAWPWLATVARRVCHDLHRGRRRLNLVPEPEPAAAPFQPDARPAGDVVEDAARAEYVAAALEGLSDRQRRLLLRHHVEGHPCADIAEDEHSSVEAVKSALARARHALQSRYEGWRGLVPSILQGAAAQIRTGSATLGRALPVTPATPALRTGTLGVLAGLLAFGFVPPGEATGPDRSSARGEPSACCRRLDTSLDTSGSAPSVQRISEPNAPVSDVPDLDTDPDGASASPVDSVGGRLISVQPPKPPDAPPTPESPPMIPAADPLPVIELPPLVSGPPPAPPPIPLDDAAADILRRAEASLAMVAAGSSSLVSAAGSQPTSLL